MDERFVRITKPGWESYTGPFGFITFVDGVSTKKHPQHEYDRVAAEISVVCAETGEQIGIQARMIASRTTRMANPRTNEDKIAERLMKEREENGAKPKLAAPVMTQRFTYPELASVADEMGIAGLREIAEPLRVKGRAIPDLIQAILKAQERLHPTPAKPA